MKSKSYILMQIKELYVNKFGYYPYQADMEVDKVKDHTVYQLLTLKKELTEKECNTDMTCLHWFRDDTRFDCN
ncbi:hypothetical protein [Dishui Lake phycodnavirus 2]|nr:hypothetical protein [Dishui Lake phycodnavirus 2]